MVLPTRVSPSPVTMASDRNQGTRWMSRWMTSGRRVESRACATVNGNRSGRRVYWRTSCDSSGRSPRWKRTSQLCKRKSTTSDHCSTAAVPRARRERPRRGSRVERHETVHSSPLIMVVVVVLVVAIMVVVVVVVHRRVFLIPCRLVLCTRPS